MSEYTASGPPTIVERIIEWLHKLPHLNYKFQAISEPFNLDINGAYVQSLVVLCGFSLLLALLLLLIIVITWVCQCCFRKSDNGRSRRHIHRLSTTLFVISAICFCLLGACLYGNEHTNKSINTATNALADINHNIRIATIQTQKLNTTSAEASRHVDELTVLIEQKSKSIPDINQTAIREVDSLLTTVSDKLDEIKNHLASISRIFGDIKFLDRSRLYGHRVEFERWILCLTLICIMIGVLFAGVISFCRQSRKGTILFSGLGIVIFIVTWIMFSLVFPITVGYADFCGGDGKAYVESRVNPEIFETLAFYKTCSPNPSHDHFPSKVPVNEINSFLTTVQNDHQKLNGLLNTLFNYSQQVDEVSREISADISQAFVATGALQSTLSCYRIHDDVATTYSEFCNGGFVGSVIVAAALFLLGTFLFFLLLLVSKSWHIFVGQPSDYVEVSDDDHFSPRGQDAMPDNVYDTNIFNPRARQIGGIVDHTTPNGNGGTLSNGNAQRYSASAAPLLADSSTWRNSATAPPAGNTLSHSHGRNSGYHLNNANRHYHHQQQEFQEQFDI